MINTTYPVSRETCKQVSNEVQAAVEAIYAKHGLDAPRITGRYGMDLTLTLKASPLVKNEAGVNTATPEARAYEMFGATYGLESGALGVVFTENGEQFRFTGISTNRPKFPINGVRVRDGRTFKFPPHTARFINAAI